VRHSIKTSCLTPGTALRAKTCCSLTKWQPARPSIDNISNRRRCSGRTIPVRQVLSVSQFMLFEVAPVSTDISDLYRRSTTSLNHGGGYGLQRGASATTKGQLTRHVSCAACCRDSPFAGMHSRSHSLFRKYCGHLSVLVVLLSSLPCTFSWKARVDNRL